MPPDDDHDMRDVSPGAETPPATVGADGVVKEKQRLRLLPGATDCAASFSFEQEDHTLGNALRYMIMKNPDVEFCGYSIPHPSEAVMNIRIQTYETTTAYAALRKGLEDLADLCDIVEDTFTAAQDDFNETNPDKKPKPKAPRPSA